MQVLRQTLTDSEAVEAGNSWIPMVGQMVMGFILPFALTFVAIPLESFIQSSRTVAGVFVTGLLRGFAFVLRLMGNIVHYLGLFMVNLYDLLIFPPLWVEKLFRGRGQQTKIETQEEAT
jgi:hypothetical protein